MFLEWLALEETASVTVLIVVKTDLRVSGALSLSSD